MKNKLRRPLVIGNGQLGTAAFNAFKDADMFTFPKVDISNIDDLLAKIDFAKYSVIINAAAATRVDDLENPAKFNMAKGVNADGPKNLAKIAKDFGIPLVHVSSDYVFDGTRKNHDEDEQFSPLSVYGKTKAEGDENIIKSGADFYILRTSWVVGKTSIGENGKNTNIVKTAYNCAVKGVKPTVVNDQIGRLTFTSELIRAIEFLFAKNAPYGVYNLTNGGEPKSLAEIWKYVYAKVGKNPDVVAETTTDDYYAGEGKKYVKDLEIGKYINPENPEDLVAFRPENSDLNLDKIKELGFISKDQLEAIDEYIVELKGETK